MKKSFFTLFLKGIFSIFIVLMFSSCMLLGGFFGEPTPVAEETPDDKPKPEKPNPQKPKPEKPTDDDNWWNDFWDDSDDNSNNGPGSGGIVTPDPVSGDTNSGNYGNAQVSQLEKAVLIELNRVRSNPPKYANEIMKQYRQTSPEAEECYRELLKTRAMPQLSFAKGLCKATDWLVMYQGPAGVTGHYTSVNGYKSPGDRMKKFGTVNGRYGENISYGYNEARAIVVVLLIDKGVASRGHRKNILTRDFKKIGIGIGTHKKYRYMCVMDFAGEYKNK